MGGVGLSAVKVAIADFAVDMVRVQVDEPEQSPDQPPKVLPDAAEAVSVTSVSALKLTDEEEDVLIPAGLLVTVPEPSPSVATDNAY